MDAPGVKGELRARSQDSDEACLMPATKTPPKGGKKGGKKSPPRWVWIAVAVAVVIAGVLWLRSRSSSTTEGNPSGYANYPSGSAYGTGGYLSPDDISSLTGTTTNPTGTTTNPSGTSTVIMDAGATVPATPAGTGSIGSGGIIVDGGGATAPATPAGGTPGVIMDAP